MKFDFAKKICVACHDAGGANQIIAMLKRNHVTRVWACMEGPAKILWDEVFPHGQLSRTLFELLADSDILITGTGWASSLEHEARKKAKLQGVYSIAVLDHWSEYMERFVREGDAIFPDEFWVVDEYALNLARQIFPGARIILHSDYYAEQQIREIIPITEVTANELLYVLEPMRSDWGRCTQGEFQALDYFFENLAKMDIPKNTLIRLRPHPSDPSGKYEEFLTSKTDHEVIIDDCDFTKSISRARWVAGCQTYAMTIALKTKRTVFCSLPPWAPECKLPHAGLIHVKDLVGV